MNELKRRKFSRGSREKKTTNKNIITLHMLKFVSILMTFISTVRARLQEIIKNNFGIWKDVQKEEALDRRRKLAWTDLARKRVNLRVTRPAIIVSSLFYSLKPLFLFPAWIFLRKLLRALEKGNAYNDIAGWEGGGGWGYNKRRILYCAAISRLFATRGVHRGEKKSRQQRSLLKRNSPASQTTNDRFAEVSMLDEIQAWKIVMRRFVWFGDRREGANLICDRYQIRRSRVFLFKKSEDKKRIKGETF